MYDPTPRDRDAERARPEARLGSILDGGGSGSVLGPPPGADDAEVALATLREAMRRDWRAASFYLERSPLTRAVWSDPARMLAEQNRVMKLVIAAVAATGIPAADEHRFLLQLQAHGLGLPSDEGD